MYVGCVTVDTDCFVYETLRYTEVKYHLRSPVDLSHSSKRGPMLRTGLVPGRDTGQACRGG